QHGIGGSADQGAQRVRLSLDGADVDGPVDDAIEPALVERPGRGGVVAGVDGGAAGQGQARGRRTAVGLERTEERVHANQVVAQVGEGAADQIDDRVLHGGRGTNAVKVADDFGVG